jgi:hypothetical protein
MGKDILARVGELAWQSKDKTKQQFLPGEVWQEACQETKRLLISIYLIFANLLACLSLHAYISSLSCGADTTTAGLGHEERPGQLPRARMVSSSPRRLRVK